MTIKIKATLVCDECYAEATVDLKVKIDSRGLPDLELDYNDWDTDQNRQICPECTQKARHGRFA